MLIKSIEIQGYSGFSTKQFLSFAQCNGRNDGSGITFLLGANNSGKSALLEAIKFFGSAQSPELDQHQRNAKQKHSVDVKLNYGLDKIATLRTVANGGSSTEINFSDGEKPKIFYLPSRRFFRHALHRHLVARDGAQQTLSSKTRDNEPLDYFSGRLFSLQRDDGALAKYNSLLKLILGYDLKWSIDRIAGSYYVQYELDGVIHTSTGVGDGIINIMIIADALNDAPQGSLLIIDEPEVSLHPSAQKRLYEVLKERSKDIQIVISTHSPYFVDFDAILNGAIAARFYKMSDEVRIAALPLEFKDKISRLLNNSRNPHILDLVAKEVFFVTDNIILVEGSDDVVCLKNASKQLGIPIEGSIFGWGVGGESNMPFFAELLHSLGYQRVCGILDKNSTAFEFLQAQFKDYSFYQISTNDIRDKKEDTSKEKIGLFTDKFALKNDAISEVSKLLEAMNSRVSIATKEVTE